jgi:hypothetical protein
MLDWLSLAFNALWILALSGMLVLLSHANFTAQSSHHPLRKVLRQRLYARLFDLCLMSFCIGLAGSVHSTLERILWLAMALVWGGQVLFWRRRQEHLGSSFDND